MPETNTFDPKAYVVSVEDYMKFEQLKAQFDQQPHNPQLRMAAGAEIYGDPLSFADVNPDVVAFYLQDSLSNRNGTGKFDLVRKATEENSSQLLEDIANSFQVPGEVVPFVMQMPYFEGDERYAAITAAHKALAKTQDNIRSRNMGAIVKDIVTDYGLADSVLYHARANPDSLINVYSHGVLGARMAQLESEFTRKDDGAVKTRTVKNYSQYVFDNASDRNAAVRAVALQAHQVYAK